MHRLSYALAAVGALAIVNGCSGDAETTASSTATSGAGGSTTATSSTESSSSQGGSAGQGGGGSICLPDADGDGIDDDVEGKSTNVDTDGDNTPDYLDQDSDGDTLPDSLEGQTAALGCKSPLDSDADGTPDFRDTDSDNNGLLDRQEIYPDQSAYDPSKGVADTDGDGTPDYADPDNDGDALLDTDELGPGGALIDTDGDGIPDLDDVDSDGDTIGDAYEGLADPDGDGIPAFRDLDSDGDGIPDNCEVGPNHNPADPPRDTDNDGKYDFLDLDSDGDGIPDAVEDANQNCVLDDGETDPYAADTDGDGVSDLIEVVLGSNPRDPLQTPGTMGKYYFVLPYMESPTPANNNVPLQTNLDKGDVAFLVDTTGTMGGEILNLKIGMSTIISELHVAIPDLAIGVAGFDDFPTDTYGTPGVDLPFYVAGPTGYLSTSSADSVAAVQTLFVHDGRDTPESQVAAMYRSLTDYYLIWDSGQLAPTGGGSGGTFGSLRYRGDALPILVAITDAPFHNGRRVSAPGTMHDLYSFNGQPPFPTPTIDDLVGVMKSSGGYFIGLSAADGSRAGADPYEDMAYLCDAVKSDVSPSAFGGAQCLTGLFGTGVAVDGPATADSPGGTCRLVFDIKKDGSGLTTSVVSGIEALLKSIKLDVRALAAPVAPDPPGNTGDSVDTFIQTIVVNASGGNDPAEPGVPCIALDGVKQLADIWSGPKGLPPKMQDAVNETALGIIPGQKICFKVIPKPNTTIPQQAGPQVFEAVLIVKAQNGAAPTELTLGSPREIAFIIPPSPQ